MKEHIVNLLEVSIENAQELLSIHDKMFGRATTKNKIICEIAAQSFEAGEYISDDYRDNWRKI